MEISVLVEPSQSNGFRATAPSHPDIVAEGTTEEAAIRTLRDQLCERLKLTKMVKVNVPTISDKPWMSAAGCLEQEPDQEAYREAILENRRQVDADASR